MESKILLTVAVICKNEEKNIKRCLDSIFRCIVDIGSFEVILVDSFSTDNTIKIAKKYPIRILQLHEDWPHSPAAGRYTALRHANGEYVLCVDADMELESNFIEKAIVFMQEHPNVAAVTGILENLFYPNKYKALKVIDAFGQSNNLNDFPVGYEGQLKSVAGAGMFRTSAVHKAGNFHPFLRAEEEHELCQRLRRCGYELWYLPIMIAKHYGYEQNEFKELIRRINNGFMAGIGEMFKCSFKAGFQKENLIRFYQHIILGCYIGIFPLIIIMSFINALFIILWIAGFVLIIMAYIIKKKNFFSGIMAFLTKAVIGLNICRMFPFNLPGPDCYPTDVSIIDMTTH